MIITKFHNLSNNCRKLHGIMSLLFVVVFISKSIGQQGFVSVGGNISNQISFSVGQIDYQFHQDSAVIWNAGIQQPFENFINFINKGKNWGEIKLFPNPFTQTFYIDFSSYSSLPNRIQIHTYLGQKIFEEKINQTIQRVDLFKFVPSNYLLLIFDQNDLLVQTVKITKI